MGEMVKRVAEAMRRSAGQNFVLPEGTLYVMAKAAIAEMREPTASMTSAGRWSAEFEGPYSCWQDMIDDALGPDGSALRAEMEGE